MKIEELFNRKIWVCYTVKTIASQKGKTRETKPPVSPLTGALELSLDKCGTYQEAVNYLKHPHREDEAHPRPRGIGLLALDGLVYIDLDDFLEDGDFSASARQDLPEFVEFVQGLPASTYVEISQSGKGLHIVGLDLDNVASQTRKTVICGRDVGLHKSRIDGKGTVHPQYVALTGKPFQSFGTSEITDISGIIREFFKLLDACNGSTLLASSSSLSCATSFPEEINGLINQGNFSRKWKSDFSALWQGNTIPDMKDPSPSGIDFYLSAQIAALVTEKGNSFSQNVEDINRLFKLSPHYASKTPEGLKKWNRVGRQTCEKALNYFLNKNSTRKEE